MEFPGERQAIRKVIISSEAYGYGNMMDRIMMGWTLKNLMNYPDWDISSCMRDAHCEDEERIKRVSKMDRKNLIEELKNYTYYND